MYLVLIAFVIVFSCSSPLQISAQQRFSKTYPVPHNSRIVIRNYSGSIRIEVGSRNEIKIYAEMDARSMRLMPEESDDGLTINVMRDNGGRADLGNVNFRIILPANSMVDVETKRGDITVRDITGQMVRAKVTLDGDIELTGLHVATVLAENTMGNILFDGELIAGGTYKLESMKGDINVRIPANSNFWLMALAPATRSIDLGGFVGNLNFGDGRRVTGNVGEGRQTSSFTVMNQRGPIFFKRR